MSLAWYQVQIELENFEYKYVWQRQNGDHPYFEWESAGNRTYPGIEGCCNNVEFSRVQTPCSSIPIYTGSWVSLPQIQL